MTTCKAITKRGTQCKNKPIYSGYCAIHDPAIEESIKKREPIDKLLKIVTETCETKGWKWEILAYDEKNFDSANIAIDKYVPEGIVSHHITAIIDLHFSKDKILTYIMEKTSFHSYGLKALKNGLEQEFDRAGWNTPKNITSEKIIDKSLDILSTIFKRFNISAQQLCNRYENRDTLTISDEYDTQDYLYSILKLFFNDIRKEEYSPSRSGSNSRIDFLLKNEQILIEVKYASKILTDKKIAEELIIDKERYKSHPDCKRLYCFIYDPNFNIKNPYGLESDLSETNDKLETRIFVYPK